MKKYFLLLTLWCAHAQAQNLSLSDYLQQVKTKNPQAQALVKLVDSYEHRLEEGDQLTAIYGFGEYNLVDDKKETMVPAFGGDRTQTMNWKAGLKQQTPFGLGASLYMTTQRVNIHGVSPTYVPQNDYTESAVVLELKQSLWQNGFGAATRADRNAMNASNRADLMANRYNLKQLMMQAESIYWTLSSYNQIVKLQQENVQRARKLRDWMRSRQKMKLVDDVDAMQAQASLEMRELELKSSLDERAAVMRTFQTLRATDAEMTETLQEFPTQEWLAKPKKMPKRPKREDFERRRAESKAIEYSARSKKSKVQPTVDLVAKFASNGRDASISDSYTEISDGKHPTWMVGVSVSFPIDLWLYSDLNSSFRQQGQAAKDLYAQADFEESRAWEDSLQRNADAQSRFESALNLEKLQEQIVARERKRLMSGRTTMFQLNTQEQNLSNAQIQRVKAQLDFVERSNDLRNFQEKL